MNNELRSNLRESYNRKAQDRDRAIMPAWKVEERRSFLLLLQQQHTRTLLELGAGTGRDGKFFQDHGLEVTCIDLSPAMVNLCRQKGLTACVMDFGDLRFPASSFDAVYALNCLLHLPKNELPTVLQAIDTVLTPTGLTMKAFGLRTSMNHVASSRFTRMGMCSRRSHRFLTCSRSSASR